jgi:hypothetical protein
MCHDDDLLLVLVDRVIVKVDRYACLLVNAARDSLANTGKVSNMQT